MIADAAFETAPEGSASPHPILSPLIRKAAVLGAGTMGSRIAAHLVNAGVPVVLLDIETKLAVQALEGLKKAKPAALFDVALASRIATGSFDDSLGLLADCDWVIEAVTEHLGIKQALLDKVARHLKPDAILSTNTSGLPVASIAARLPDALRRRWLGTHFFNPPRYMRLVEIIATPETDPAVVAAISEFSDQRLGKEVVPARDTPNFIANRIGLFTMLEAVRLMQEEDLTIEEVDALTGTAIGWPRTGTFRLADLVGLDVLVHVASNFPGGAPEIPQFIRTMFERRWLGDKTGQGFYKKEKDTRLALDWKALEYRPAEKPRLPALDVVKNAERLEARVRLLLQGDVRKDKAARFHWRLLTALWNYAADCLPEIADSPASVDRAMRAGFNWEMGPFQLWDAAGVRETVERMKASGQRVGPVAEELLASGATAWHREPVVSPLAAYRAANGVIRKNAGASLIDLGEGVAALELHSMKDAIGEDIVRLAWEVVRPDSDAVRDFAAFVIASDSGNFSVGANLMQLLLAAQEGEWDEIERAVRDFQRMTAAMKFCPRPVVAAPFGFCFGGGAEMALHGVRRQAHAELYMGLVEAGVGLLPAGGGCKEMALQALEGSSGRAESVEVFHAVRRVFETIAMAKASTSAFEARSLGLLKPADGITMNRDHLLADARRLALELAPGYAPPTPPAQIPAPGENLLASLKMGVHMMREGEYISDHDVKVANRIAHVLCGGAITPGTPVTEQYFLDLEREGFLSLCGEKKTQERIAYTLKTGKPLRN